MAGLNISLLSLNRRQSSSDKKHNLSWHLVLFFSFCCFFSHFPTVFFIDSKTNETIPLQFPRCFSLFFYEKNTLRKTLWENLFLSNVCEVLCKLQVPIKGRNFGVKLTHLCGFWLDVSFFSHMKKHHWRFLLDVSFFSRVKTIICFFDWLELKYDTAFWSVFLSMYINKDIYVTGQLWFQVNFHLT